MTAIEPSAQTQSGPIILFDAECVLCSANAQFVLKHDKAGHFRLASMQGETGAEIYRRQGMDPNDPSSMLVIDGNRVRQDSDAVLSIYEALSLPWRLFGILRVVPAFFVIPFIVGLHGIAIAYLERERVAGWRRRNTRTGYFDRTSVPRLKLGGRRNAGE